MTANEGTRREKQRRQLSLPTVMRLSDCAVRFLLTAVLAGAELMGGHALFALSLVAVCQPGLEGLAALLGALCIGGPYFLRKVTFGPAKEYEAVTDFYIDYAVQESGEEYTYFNQTTWTQLITDDVFTDKILMIRRRQIRGMRKNGPLPCRMWRKRRVSPNASFRDIYMRQCFPIQGSSRLRLRRMIRS